jgi:glycine cleavage system T protein (aminomethyltransferase)
MVPFAGWEMPLQFSGIVDEHNAVRGWAGVFDVSHMGRLIISGPDAAILLRRAVTFNVNRLKEWQSHYAILCQEDGGIIDDLVVYRLDRGRFLIVDNASNADTDRDHVASLIEPAMDVTLDDTQSQTAMIAIQGPKAPALLAETITAALIEQLPRHGCMEFELMGSGAFIAEGGYTGEEGYEIIVDAARGHALWRGLLSARAKPCGLGARDTLRLEAALALYGNDIDRTTNPFEAGLGWVVDLDDDPFVGKEALLRVKQEGVRRLVCLEAEGKGIMRSGFPVLHGGKAIGKVTSGGFSPTLGVSIGMAYVSLELSEVGTSFEVDVRGKPLPARVVKRPFYRRS